MTFWVAGAVVVSSAIGANAAGHAASAQGDAAAASDATQRYMYDTTRADNAPFRQTGLDANNRLAALMGLSGDPKSAGYGSLSRNFGMSDLNSDPVYKTGLQFGLDQGTQGINRQAAANGSFLSGATLKALTRYGNDYGSTKANESYNRFNTNQTNQYNRLAGLSGAGQQATNQVSAAGQNMANNVSANQIGAGNARASGYMGQANAISGGLNSYLNYSQNQNMLNRFQPQPNYGAFNDMSGYNTDGSRSITGGR